MTIDEVINGAEEIAFVRDGTKKVKAVSAQIAEWLKELKVARSVLEGHGLHYHDGRFYSTKAYKELVKEGRR